MREIRQNKPKLKPSKFFEPLIQKYGEMYALDKATNQEISDKIRFFIHDLVYGNLLQEKYTKYILNDITTSNRLITATSLELDYKYKRANIVLYSLTKLFNSNDPITSEQEFSQCYMDADLRVKAYQVLKQGIINLTNSGNPQFLEWIAIQFNTQLRGAKNLI